MSQNQIFTLIALFINGFAGLAGGVLPIAFIHNNMPVILSFAAGTLLGTSLLDLLPEALHQASHLSLPHNWVLISALFGFLSFYAIESFLGNHASGQSGHRHSAAGPLMLLGDALHNATDGIAIAIAFTASTSTGILASVAVIVHELPQEISDYAILISGGYSKTKALAWLFLVQFSAFIGAFFTFFIGERIQIASPILLSAASGGFLYVACADLLPELKIFGREARRVSSLIAFIFGIVIISVLEHFIKHD